MVSYHHVKYQKITNNPTLRKLSDGRTDEQADGKTDKSDFTGRCPTNFERPITKKLNCYLKQGSLKDKETELSFCDVFSFSILNEFFLFT